MLPIPNTASALPWDSSSSVAIVCARMLGSFRITWVTHGERRMRFVCLAATAAISQASLWYVSSGK